jgi:phosphatidylserine decarboxylase
MKITPYGKSVLAWMTLLCGALAAGAAWLAWMFSPVVLVSLLVPAVVWGWAVWFFRDPDRESPSEPNLVVAPADGRVADITPLGEESELGEDGVRIGIFMNVVNVHVNRMPMDAVVVETRHRPGLFMDVRDPVAAEKNESTTLKLLLRQGGTERTVLVRQVAGLVARRIVTDVQPGQSFHRGQRFGMIRFGSRLEVLLPADLVEEVRVTVGQKTLAGETILATLKEAPA